MSNLAPSEKPVPPSIAWDAREKLACMRRAVAAAIAHGNRLSDIRPTAWATHFGCDCDDIRIAWEAELTRQSLKPCQQESDGK
jgi:hypothetical protein